MESANGFTRALIAAAKFHHLAAFAAANGGFWVSAAGGTANVVAGEISRATGVTFGRAHDALDEMGGEGWYAALADAQPYPACIIPGDGPGEWWVRWDARTIARAACRAATL